MKEGMTKCDDDLIQYVRDSADELAVGAAYLVDIVELADQIKDEPDNRAKLAGELGRKRMLLETHLAAVQGLLARAAPDPADADETA